MKITLVIALAFFHQTVSGNTKVKIDTLPVINKAIQKATTLDSMQGNWVNSKDASDRIFVKGRSYQELYISRKDTLDSDYYRIYFSDSLVEIGNFRDIKIDTTLSSGKFLILRSIKDTEEFWSYVIDGFFFKEPVPYFLITDTWAKRRETAFEKVKNKKGKVKR